MMEQPNAVKSQGRSGEVGQTIVEFALIGTLFLFLVGAIVQGGLIFNAWLVVTNAAREGARIGAPCYQRTAPAPTPTTYPVTLTCDSNAVKAAVYQAAAGVAPSSLTIQVSAVTQQIDNIGTGGHKVKLLTVYVSYNVPIVTPFFAAILPNPFPVTATSTVRIENQSP